MNLEISTVLKPVPASYQDIMLKSQLRSIVPDNVQIGEVEQSLSAHLKDVKRKLNCSSITYVALIKDTHLLEVPEVSSPDAVLLNVSALMASITAKHSLVVFRYN